MNINCENSYSFLRGQVVPLRPSQALLMLLGPFSHGGLMKFYLFNKRTNKSEEVEAEGSGNQWMAICPEHDDHNPSLSINPEMGEKGVYNCLGCGFSGQLCDPPDNPEGEPDPLVRSIAIYEYKNAQGDLLFQVLKYPAPPPKNKTFRQRRPDGKGEWIWNLEGVTPVPYRLPQLLSGCDPIFIVEGEKDVESLRDLGLTATCNPMGAGKWKSIYDRYFGGSDVVIIPDNDEPGRNHGKQVARSLKGIAKSVRVVELPYLLVNGDNVPMPEHGDVSDLLSSLTHPTKEDFLKLINLEELERKDEDKTDEYHFVSGTELLARPKPEVEWVVDGMFGAGHLGLVLGKPKDGKTYFTFNLAVCVSRGIPFLGRETTQGPVLYLSLDWDNIERYMEMMGGDFSNIHFHCGMAPKDAVPKLIKMIEESSPRLAVVDIMQKLIKMKEEKGYAEAIDKLEPLSDVARRARCCIILNHHAPKAEREVVDAALGSTGYVASANTSVLIKKDASDRRAFYTLQREHKPGEQDIKGEILNLAADGITLTQGGTLLEVSTNELKAEIIKLLSELGEGTMTQEDIVRAVKRKKDFVLKALRELEQEFLIRKSGSGRRNDPKKYSLRRERII